MKLRRYLLSIYTTTMMFVVVCTAATSFAINIGDPFPLFTKTNSLSSDECSYLGISPGKDFALNDVQHDVLIVEFLNVYCHTCRQQVEIFNDLFKTVQQEPELSGKVCIIGIAVGNTPEEIGDFKKNYGVLYPVLSDQNKALFNSTGNTQGTPHTYILRKEEQRFIIDYHAGGVTSKDRYLSTVRFALRGTFTGTTPGNKAPDFAFLSGTQKVDGKSFQGKRVILYFPVTRNYPLAIDTRNRGNQIKILHEIVTKFPGITTVIFKHKGFSLPKALTTESFIIADEAEKNSLAMFRAADTPTVYYINEYGRVAFKGEAITLYNAEAILQGKEYKPVPEMKESDIVRLLEEHLTKTGKAVAGTEKEILDNGKTLYVTTLEPKRDGIVLFSLLESRPSLCDICHDTHFVYTIDQAGMIVDFFPLQITKFGNIPWTEEDMQKIKTAVAGKSIFETFPFNPKVDAVTTATMSSSLVFEAFNEGKDTFKNFKAYKFRYEYWKDICFQNICSMQNTIAKMKINQKDLTLEDALGKVLSDMNNARCPLDGMYIVLDGNILCSIHGIQKECPR